MLYEPVNLVCAPLNVSLQESCAATLDVSKIYEPCTEVLVEIQDGVEEELDGLYKGIVNVCGTYKYTLTDACDPNNTCWSYITAEDKQPPLLDYCPEEVSGWSTYNYGYQDFICDDIEWLLLGSPVTYTMNSGGVIDWSSVSTKHARWMFEHVTGYATFTDNCGDIHVTVSDVVSYGYNPDCDDVTITRTFKAVDSCGDPSEAAYCYQDIIITKPTLEDVYCPKDVELACDKDFKLDANGNPHPDVTGYPWLYKAFDVDYVKGEDKWWEYEHKAYLNPKYCNLGASYTDGARITVCEGTYKIVRTWEILDWCSKEVYECKQIIKVEDKKGPKVTCEDVDYDNDGHADLRTYSTGPYDCTAAFQVPMPKVKDNCSSFEVLTEIVAYTTSGAVVATILPGKPRYVSGIPLGCHYIKYTVTDACGNKTVEYCPFKVEDQVEPIAVCDDDLNVSIGGQGLARVFAKDIDEGSSDNCGPIRIEVRRRVLLGPDYECLDFFDYDGDGEVIEDEVNLSVQFGDPEGDGNGEKYWYTPWLDYVDFTCCDMNENVRIELRVWDDRNGNGKPGDIAEAGCEYDVKDVKDNFNVCWMDLLIEDKLPAYCVPPLPKYIDCDKLPYDFDPTDSDQMSELFGEATGTDNCPGYTIEELSPLTDDLNDCGYGTFVRRFAVSDAKGQTSTNKCEQVVTIKEKHYYKIKFPKDAAAVCGDPMPDTVEVEELACDLLAISVKDDFFSASGDECYKIFRTYSVINWCEYDGISDPVVVSRDEDCDGKPGDEDIWVIVKTRDKPDPCYDYYGGYQAPFYSHVWYDRDSDPFNLLPKAGTKGYNCEYETNPFGFWKEVVPITENEDPKKDTDNYPKGYYGDHCDDMASVGYWQYTQVIKVYDNIDPIITWNELEPFCSYSSDFDNDCPAQVSIDFTVDENCTPDDLTITLYVDLDQDGVLDTYEGLTYTGTYPNYNVTATFPLGAHYLGVSVEDGCGNQAGKKIPFEVVDCKAPTPVCINGLAIELMPVIPAADADGDGDEDKGAMAIWASDFIASPSYDCTGEVKYSINRVGEEVDADQTGITLTCDDDASLLVEIWAWDGAGNGDFCETYVLVQDNMVQCSDSGSGSIAGVIATEELTTVAGVQVGLSGNSIANMATTNDGHFIFSNLTEGFDYTITPLLDSNPLNGVSTFDLVLMSKHILGLQPLNSAYKIIAADVNGDKRVTAQDAIALRRLILNIDTKFASNTSWRFVDAAHQFSVPTNPWADDFAEVININDLQGALANADFVAIKTGDLSLDAKANALTAETRNAQGVFALNVAEVSMKAGNEYRVAVTSAQLSKLQGFQGTLTLDNSKVELLDIEYGVATAANFGMHLLDAGMITTSWDGKAGDNDVLFTLVVRARATTELSKVLGISSRVTKAEAYNTNDEVMDLAINFGNGEVVSAGFELGQNSPNPFRTQTVINYNLPEAANVTFTISDAAGKLLQVLRTSGAQGKNTLTLDRKDLPAGVLFYTLTTDDFTATKSMVVE
ncbi:T9SS type A sorting domain-containing protein [Candidatus Saccharibacteria bacterium]|nr:T9SS type A sorting domain-containing protein [Candidatus Saccharibacteria bacterium]